MGRQRRKSPELFVEVPERIPVGLMDDGLAAAPYPAERRASLLDRLHRFKRQLGLQMGQQHALFPIQVGTEPIRHESHRRDARLAIGKKFTELPPQLPVVFQQSCLLYTSPSPRDLSTSRMPSSA